jgi:hypothetical protein
VNPKPDPPGNGDIIEERLRAYDQFMYLGYKNSKLLATFDNYHLLPKNSRFDLFIRMIRNS